MNGSNATPRLGIFSQRGLSLEAALAAFAPTLGEAAAIGFTLGPDAFSFIRLDGAGRAAAPHGASSVNGVYEARVFHERAELRWLRDPRHDSGHSTVVLTDGSCTVDLPSLPFEVPLVGFLPQTYVLWGEAGDEKPTAGWTRLTTARIGPLDVPITGVRENERVAIRSVEYLGQLAHGNVAVVEERLCGLMTFEQR
jgi:CRISPR-associated protein (TIGR03984 family)